MSATGPTGALSEARAFLQALFTGKPDKHYVLLWTLTLPEKESHWFRNVDDAVRFAESRPDRDLYVGVGLAPRKYGRKRRCVSKDISAIVGVWADLDLRSDAHPNKALPTTVEEALQILPSEFPPTFVINSGNGVHVWWLFSEPLLFESATDRAEAEKLSKRWQTHLSSQAAIRGWKLDRLSDLARVLRVPGTRNCKDAENRKSVVIAIHNDRRYNPSEFAGYLDQLNPLDQNSAAATMPLEYAQGIRDTPLAINLSARIGQDQLNEWLDTDSRFKQTWFRQREDLPDQSQSGYDLALVHFGFAAELREQEIVDLIVHHRALHKQQKRTGLDYFRRMFSKVAYASASSTDRMALPPDASKAAICQKLSETLGVSILRITKVSGHLPVYQMELACGKVEFSDVGKLINQGSLRNKLAAACGKIIRRFRTKEWEEIAQALLDACTVEDGGEEMELEGAARLRINQYLSAVAFIDSLEGQHRESVRKPMIVGETITICLTDLQSFIAKTGYEAITTPSTAAILHAVDATARRFRGKYPEHTRWLLPPDKFPLSDFNRSGGEVADANL